MKHIFRTSLWLPLALLAALTSALPQAPSGLRLSLDQALDQLKTYDYTWSTAPLVVIEQSVGRVAGDPAQTRQIAQRLADVLAGPQTTAAAKLFICQQLRLIGTKDQVPLLAKMLDDPQTADMARLALHGIPDAAATEALIAAVSRLKGERLIGVINSLGTRHDTAAIPALTRLLGESDPQVASAAARALGQVGTKAAAEALMKVKPRPEILPGLTEAQLAVAETLAGVGDYTTAKAIYQRLWASRYPLNLRMAALAGLVQVDPPTALSEIVKLLKSGEPELQRPAAGMTRRFRDPGAFVELAKLLPRLNPQGQVLVVTLLADRGDPSFAKSVVALLDSPDETVRAAAAAALGKLGNADSVEPLARRAAGDKSEVQQAARRSLRLLVAPGVDERLLTVAAAGVPPVRAGALLALADRQVTNALAVLLQAAEDNNLEVARAAFEALGALGTPDIYGKLVALLAKANTSTELAIANKAVVSVGGRIAESEARRRPLLEAVPKAEGYGKAGLIELLAAEGGLEAFRAVRKGLDDPNLTVRTQAVLALQHWSDPSVADELYKLAQGDRRGAVQTAALNGYLRSTALAPTNRLEMLRKARMIIGTDAEKKMLLATLAEIEEPGALEFATGLLADTEARAEAVVAVLKLADTLARNQPDAVQAAIARLLQVTKDPATIRQAEAILKKSRTGL